MTYTHEQLVDIIAASDIGEGLSPAGLSRLADICHQVDLEEGEVLLEEGSPGEHLYLLASGLVQVLFSNYEDGQFQEVCKLRSGSMLGEMSLLENQTRSARTVALEPIVALAMGREDFDRVLETDLDTGYRTMRNIARALSQRLRFTNMALRHGFLN